MFKETSSGGEGRAEPAGLVNFYHKVKPFLEVFFLLSSLHISTEVSLALTSYHCLP